VLPEAAASWAKLCTSCIRVIESGKARPDDIVRHHSHMGASLKRCATKSMVMPIESGRVVPKAIEWREVCYPNDACGDQALRQPGRNPGVNT
jgi:hypothetical protein